MFMFLKKETCVLFHTLVWQLKQWMSILWLLCQCIFEFIVNEKWSFFNWRGDTWVRKGDMNLIYWYIRQMTRWCVVYTGECPSILARTYEWTLRFVWMLSVSSSDLFYWLVHQSTPYLSQVLTDSFRALSFFKKLPSFEWEAHCPEVPWMCMGQLAVNDRLVGYIKGCLFVKVGLHLTQCTLHSLLFCIVVTRLI